MTHRKENDERVVDESSPAAKMPEPTPTNSERGIRDADKKATKATKEFVDRVKQ
jgi:hypothetical protein